jgi:hypothetical protein
MVLRIKVALARNFNLIGDKLLAEDDTRQRV